MSARDHALGCVARAQAGLGGGRVGGERGVRVVRGLLAGLREHPETAGLLAGRVGGAALLWGACGAAAGVLVAVRELVDARWPVSDG